MSVFSVRLADWAHDRDALRQIRSQVFIEEQGVPVALEWDDADADAQHALALDQNHHPIGCARLLRNGKIGRMAVLPQWRRHGVGSALLKCLLHTAAAQQLPATWLEAQLHALPFYASLGFVAEGEVYLDADIEHRLMRLAPTRSG